MGGYENFEQAFEWRIAPKGNSGVKYRSKDGVGPEYQVRDDRQWWNGRNPPARAAALYDMFPADTEEKLKPVGEFNRARIVANGTILEHWLNGKLVMATDTGSRAWAEAKARSKFRGKVGIGEGKGKIMIQDHGDAVWYRHIRIRILK